MYKFLFPKRKKFEINSADITFKVHYLGNVVTSMMKGEGCVDKPVGILWNNHLKHNGKSGIKMKLTLTQGGLCVSTKTSGISEYYGHRIHYIVAHELHPKLFVWVYQHVNKNLKTELRCHAVLCKRETDAKLIATLLNEKIVNTFNEYKREKRRKQNARLVNAISGSLYPMRKASLRSTGKYKPPIQRGMCGAPKLDDVTEEEEEEEEQELEQQQNLKKLNKQNFDLTSLCCQKSITNHNNHNNNDAKNRENNNNNNESSSSYHESLNMITNKTNNNELVNRVNSNRRINNENLNPNTSNSTNNHNYNNNKLIKTIESNNKTTTTSSYNDDNVNNNNNKDNCNKKHRSLNNNNNELKDNDNVKYLVINEDLINSLIYDSSDGEGDDNDDDHHVDDHEIIDVCSNGGGGGSVVYDERTEINCKLDDINNKVSEKNTIISDNIQLSPSINSLNSNSASDSGIGESFTNLNYEFGNDIDSLRNDKDLRKAINNLHEKLIFNSNKENTEVIIVNDDDEEIIGNNTITCEDNNESENNTSKSLDSTLNSDKCEINKDTCQQQQQQVSYDYVAELNNNKTSGHRPVIKQRLNSSFRFRNPFKRIQLSASFNSYTTYKKHQEEQQQQQQHQQEQEKEKIEENKTETKTEKPEPKIQPQIPKTPQNKPELLSTKPILNHQPTIHQTAFIKKSPKHPLTTIPHITNNESIIAIVAN